jgi:hypothetical protein
MAMTRCIFPLIIYVPDDHLNSSLGISEELCPARKEYHDLEFMSKLEDYGMFERIWCHSFPHSN